MDTELGKVKTAADRTPKPKNRPASSNAKTAPHGKKKASGKTSSSPGNPKKEKGGKQGNPVGENSNRAVRVTKKSKGPRKANENDTSTSETPSHPPAQKAEDKTIFDLLFSGGSDEVLPPSPAKQPISPPKTESPVPSEYVYSISDLLAIRDEMIKNGFNHYSYMNHSYYRYCLTVKPKEEEAFDWDMPDDTTDCEIDLSRPLDGNHSPTPVRGILQQFRRGEQAYIPPSLQTDVLNALFEDVLEREPMESVGWVDEMLVVHEGEKTVVMEEKKKSKKEKKKGKKGERSEGAKSKKEKVRSGRSGERVSEEVHCGDENEEVCLNENEEVYHDENDEHHCEENDEVHPNENDRIHYDENYPNENHLTENDNNYPNNDNNYPNNDNNHPSNNTTLNPIITNTHNELPTKHLPDPATPSQEAAGEQSVSWLESLIEPAPVDAPRASLLQESSGDLAFGLQGLLPPFPQEEKEPLGAPGLFPERFGFLGNELDLFGRKESPEQMGFFGGEEKGGIIDMLQGSSRDLEGAPSLLQIARDNMDREEKEKMKKVAEEKEKRRLEAIARAEAKKSNVDLPESTIKKAAMGLKPRSIMLRKRKWSVCLESTVVY